MASDGCLEKSTCFGLSKTLKRNNKSVENTKQLLEELYQERFECGSVELNALWRANFDPKPGGTTGIRWCAVLACRFH
jgi:hypothetical protein